MILVESDGQGGIGGEDQFGIPLAPVSVQGKRRTLTEQEILLDARDVNRCRCGSLIDRHGASLADDTRIGLWQKFRQRLCLQVVRKSRGKTESLVVQERDASWPS